MSIRNKTKKRLLILAGAVLGLTLVGGAGVWIRVTQFNAEREHELALAMTAAKEGRDAQAIAHFRRSKGLFIDDPDGLYWLAHARQRVPLPNGKHLTESISYLDRALRLRPDFPEAREDLLNLYIGIQLNSEALTLAERTLESDPVNLTAIRSKAIALSRLDRLDDAIETLHDAIAARPSEYRLHLLAVGFLSQPARQPQRALELARAAAEAHPDDPRFKIVLGWALVMSGETQAGVDTVTPLVDRTPPDEEYLLSLINVLDAAGRFDLSLSALRNGAATLDSQDIRRMFVRRLWEAGVLDEAAEQLDAMDLEAASVHADLVAIRALIHVSRNENEQIGRYRQILEKREEDPRAQAWAIVLGEPVTGTRNDPGETLKTLDSAIVKDPENAYMAFARGNILDELGESESAIAEWTRAANLSVSWYQPFMRMAQVLSKLGRHDQAIATMIEAQKRAPSNGLVALVALDVQYRAVQANPAGSTVRARLLDQVAAIQQQNPNEPRTLPVYVDLLATAGQSEKAERVAREAIAAADPKKDQDMLVRLAVVGLKHGLKIEDQALTLVESTQALTPDLVGVRLEFHLQASGRADARRYLDRVVTRLGAESRELKWRKVIAAWLDRLGDPEAGNAWAALVREYPTDPDIQRAALDVESIREDRDLQRQIVTNLKALGGESGLQWRLAEIRLLTHPTASDSELRQAVSRLEQIIRSSPQHVEPRMILAGVQQRLGLSSALRDQLAELLTLQPGNAAIRLQAAEVAADQGDAVAARAHLTRLESDGLNATGIRRAARVYSVIGDQAAAAKLLKLQHQATPDDVETGLLLAHTHFALGETQNALSVLDSYASRTDPRMILAKAQILASTGKYAQGVDELERLDNPAIPIVQREMAAAAFHRSFITQAGPERPIAHYRAAINADKSDPAPYRALIELQFALGRIDEALDTAKAAAAACPADEAFKSLVGEAALIRSVGKMPFLVQLPGVIANGGAEGDAAIRFLRIANDAQRGTEPTPNAAAKLREIVDRWPSSLPLRLAMIDWYTSNGRITTGAELANRTATAFPDSTRALERAAKLSAQAGDWSGALNAAERWKRVSPGDPREADTVAAQALLALRRPREALQRIEPYRVAAIKEPESHRQIVVLYASALIANTRTQEAANVLKPLLPSAPHWRSAWIQLAITAIPDVATAAQWLERLGAVLPDDAVPERIALADAWSILGQRDGQGSFDESALATIEPLVEGDAPSANALFVYAVILNRKATQAADAGAAPDEVKRLNAQAESAYRRCIAAQPRHAPALNNLAMLLADRKASLDEAARFAKLAVEGLPDNPSVLDTLATVEIQRNRWDQAIEALERAVRLDPDNPEWRVNLAFALHQKGDARRVTELLRALESIDASSPSLSTTARKRLRDLRSATKEQAAG